MGIDQVAGAGAAVVGGTGQRFFIVGGAGFIGSHFTDQLLGEPAVAGVTLYDNFSSGREWHYAHHAKDARLRVVRGQVEDTEALVAAMHADACVLIPTVSPDRITPHTEGLCAVVWHLLVSHPALKRAATKWESTK